MKLRHLPLCFRVAILLLLCPKLGKANPDEVKDIPVSSRWHAMRYDNDNINPATQTITHETGIKRRQTNTRMIVATHSAGAVISKGDLFKIVSVQLSYTFTNERTESYMSEEEVYNSRKIETRVVIPPRSTLTRWELITDVAGTEINGKHYIDIINNSNSTPRTYTSLAKVHVRRRINFGHTRIRIKNLERNEYITVIENYNNWPAATLGHSSRYLFILCEDSRGIRIKTLNTTHPGYVWAYSTSGREVYFDWHRQIGYSYNINVNKQHWLISKEEPHYDGDVVTFKNKYYTESGMWYHGGTYTPNVLCYPWREHKWVLETVSVRDCPIDHCK